MKHNNKKTQQGFILITVMLLTMIAGTVVLTSLSDTTTQERLSGNFQKKINSRMMAEKGVYASLNELNNLIADNTALTIEELVASANSSDISNGDNDSMFYGVVFKDSTTDASLASDEISIKSKGAAYEGEVQLEAIYTLVSGSINSPFPFGTGITACEGVTVGGSGSMDSYDSSLGDYDELNNSNSNVTVETLFSGPVTFTGAAVIDGDVLAADAIIFGGGAEITGNIESDGDLTLSGNCDIGGNVSLSGSYTQTGSGRIGGTIQANGDITVSQIAIGGNLISKQNISVTGQTVAGYLLALNDIEVTRATIQSGAFTHANYSQTGGTVSQVRAVGDVSLTQWGSVITSDDLRYAGTGSFQGDHPEYAFAPYLVSEPPTIPDVPTYEYSGNNGESDSSATTCDPYDIDAEVNNVNDKASTAPDLIVSGSGGRDAEGVRPENHGSGDVYQLSQFQSDFVLNYGSASSAAQQVISTSMEFLSTNYNILMFDDVTISGHLKIEDGQDVAMYVAGDFTMDGASSLTIPDGSSLTLIIKGALTIGSGAQIYTPDNGVTASGVPVFSIFSSYVGDGITITGGTEEIYAVIYAPLTNVTVNTGSDFKGSVLGNTISLTGAGKMHYDEALGNAGLIPDSDNAPKFIFKGWRYVTDASSDDPTE